MSKVLRRLWPVVPILMAAMMVAACSSTPSPTATDAPSTTTAVAAAGLPASASVLIRGAVFDSSNRPVANANVECASNAQCRRFGDVSTQDGPDDGVRTDANGRYALIVTPTGGGQFLLNASARGYGIVWHELELPDPACSWAQARCALTQNFTLTVAPE
jgi:hypothetical protein